MFSDAGSTPAASTIIQLITRLPRIFFREGGFWFYAYIQVRWRICYLSRPFSGHLVFSIFPPFILCLAPDSPFHSDLNIDEYSAIPEGTGLVREYSTDGSTTWDATVPAEGERPPNLAADVLVRVRFPTGMNSDMPALNFKDVNLVGYIKKTSGVHLARENKPTY